MSIERKQVGARMCQAVIHGNTIYLAGQVSSAPTVATQTQDILATIDALLASCGSDKAKILSATIYLADINTFAQMNESWDAWVDRGNPPARATVEAKMVAPEYKVEIQIVAAV